MSEKSLAVEETLEALSLEEAFARLDELISQLEKPENALEDAFRAFEQGMGLIKYCNETIDRVEKKVLVLEQDGTCNEF